jgi:hypothetical protein
VEIVNREEEIMLQMKIGPILERLRKLLTA